MNTKIYLIKKKGGGVGAEEKHLKRSVTQLASISTDTRTYFFIVSMNQINSEKNAVGEE